METLVENLSIMALSVGAVLVVFVVGVAVVAVVEEAGKERGDESPRTGQDAEGLAGNNKNISGTGAGIKKGENQ